MLLTDEEKPQTTEELGARADKAMPDEIFQAGVDAGAKAQLKKVVEWADTPCDCVPNGGRLGKECPICWQALLEEIK